LTCRKRRSSRLKQVDTLRDLCLSLMKAKPISDADAALLREQKKNKSAVTLEIEHHWLHSSLLPDNRNRYLRRILLRMMHRIIGDHSFRLVVIVPTGVHIAVETREIAA